MLTTHYLPQATEFHDAWFQSSRKQLESAGLLTEYFKHTDLCAACAISATVALEKKSSKMASTEKKLGEYIEQSGAWAPEANGIKTVRSLLDIMLITGVIHGGTLSMTRLFSVVKSAPLTARLLRLLKARPAAQGSPVLLGRDPATRRPATTSGARESRLQGRRFHRF